MCNPSQHNPDKQNLLWLVKELKKAVTKNLLCLFLTPQKLQKCSSLLYDPKRHLSKKELGWWESTECMITKNPAESPYIKQFEKGLISV